MTDQQWLARFFNSHWYNSSTVTGRIIQQSWADIASLKLQILRHLNCRYRVCFGQELLDSQTTIKCGFTRKSVRDTIRVCSTFTMSKKLFGTNSLNCLNFLECTAQKPSL